MIVGIVLENILMWEANILFDEKTRGLAFLCFSFLRDGWQGQKGGALLVTLVHLCEDLLAASLQKKGSQEKRGASFFLRFLLCRCMFKWHKVI